MPLSKETKLNLKYVLRQEANTVMIMLVELVVINNNKQLNSIYHITSKMVHYLQISFKCFMYDY